MTLIHICGAQWLSPYVSAKELQRLGLGLGLVLISA